MNSYKHMQCTICDDSQGKWLGPCCTVQKWFTYPPPDEHISMISCPKAPNRRHSPIYSPCVDKKQCSLTHKQLLHPAEGISLYYWCSRSFPWKSGKFKVEQNAWGACGNLALATRSSYGASMGTKSLQMTPVLPGVPRHASHTSWSAAAAALSPSQGASLWENRALLYFAQI